MNPRASILLVLAALIPGGCASTSPSGTASGAEETEGRRPILPVALSSRWSAPDFATRVVDAERMAVVNASVGAANALGYSVNRVDGAAGRVYATRAPAASFEGARQATLEINLTSLAPGSTQVALTLREAVESAGDGRSAPMVTTAMVRDRASYDAFFERLGAALVVKP